MADPKIVLFYVFTPLADPEAVRLWQKELCGGLGLRGRIILSPHGINATVGGEREAVRRYVRRLRAYAPFRSADVKWSHGSGLTAEPGPSGWRESLDFPRLSVKVRREIVTFGAPDELQVDEHGVVGGGTRLSPQALDALLAERGEEVVLFDGRNAYESSVGRFDGAVLPEVDTATELLARIDAGDFDDLKDRPVVTYCTGGIRCEVLSSLMRARGFEDVYQLDGGIVRYGETFGNAGHWSGALYVFDGRTTMDFPGGTELVGRCTGCGAPTNRVATVDAPEGRIQLVRCDACAAEA